MTTKDYYYAFIYDSFCMEYEEYVKKFAVLQKNKNMDSNNTTFFNYDRGKESFANLVWKSNNDVV